MEHRVQQPKKKRKQTSPRISRLATDTKRHDQLEIHRCDYTEHRVQQPEEEDQTNQKPEEGVWFGGARLVGRSPSDIV